MLPFFKDINLYSTLPSQLGLFSIIHSCETVDFGESDKMIKICGKMDKSDTYKGFSSSDISFFIQEFLQMKHFPFWVFLHLSNWGNKITEKKKVWKERERV